MFASKTPRDLNSDPSPWRNPNDGARRSHGVKWISGADVLDPRPEYDYPQNSEPNPILVAFREYMALEYNAEQLREAAELWRDATEGNAPGMLAQDLADEAVLSADPDRDPPRAVADAWSSHARRVLTRLATLAEQETTAC